MITLPRSFMQASEISSARVTLPSGSAALLGISATSRRQCFSPVSRVFSDITPIRVRLRQMPKSSFIPPAVIIALIFSLLRRFFRRDVENAACVLCGKDFYAQLPLGRSAVFKLGAGFFYHSREKNVGKDIFPKVLVPQPQPLKLAAADGNFNCAFSDVFNTHSSLPIKAFKRRFTHEKQKSADAHHICEKRRHCS